MSTNRTKTKLVHIKNKVEHPISREKKTGKLFIRNTNIEVPAEKVCRAGQNPKKLKRTGYDFSKPAIAQNLGDEWSDYAWTANDF